MGVLLLLAPLLLSEGVFEVRRDSFLGAAKKQLALSRNEHHEKNPILAYVGHMDVAVGADPVFPKFDQIKPEDVEPAMKTLLKEGKAELDRITAEVSGPKASKKPTVDSLVHPVALLGDRVGQGWGLVQHLSSVKDSEPLRAVVKKMQPEMVKFWQSLSQSKELYNAFK